jgi:hypothetical protein
VNPPGCASVLTGALLNNSLVSVKLLIEAGASMQACVGDISLLVQTATVKQTDVRVHDQIAILNMLLDAGVKTRTYTGGRTLLHEILREPLDPAFSNTSLPVLLNVFLAHNPGMLEARDDMGDTPLLSSFAAGDIEYVYGFDKTNALMDAGADPTVCNALGETVLMKATRCNAVGETVMNEMRYEFDRSSIKFISKVIKSILSRT